MRVAHWVERARRGLDLDNVETGRGMCVIINFTLFADGDALHPLVIERLVDGPPCLGVRVEHVLDHITAFAGDEIIEWWRGRRGRFGRAKTVLGAIGVVGGVGILRDAPGQFLELHAVKDDGGGPDVYLASIIFWRGDQLASCAAVLALVFVFGCVSGAWGRGRIGTWTWT